MFSLWHAMLTCKIYATPLLRSRLNHAHQGKLLRFGNSLGQMTKFRGFFFCNFRNNKKTLSTEGLQSFYKYVYLKNY